MPKILKNQTLYQCLFCGKRMLSKSGARLHEEKYCSDKESPNKKALVERQKACDHKKKKTIYKTMPGECILEPDYDLCLDCGLRF